jgi:hypothetical protein
LISKTSCPSSGCRRATRVFADKPRFYGACMPYTPQGTFSPIQLPPYPLPQSEMLTTSHVPTGDGVSLAPPETGNVLGAYRPDIPSSLRRPNRYGARSRPRVCKSLRFPDNPTDRRPGQPLFSRPAVKWPQG